MPHSLKAKYDEHLTFDALLEAHKRASKTKRNSKEVLKFEIDLETNLANLYKKLKEGTYRMGKYREFVITEPKTRVIRSLPYVDRIVHQWYVYEFIKPYIVPRFIKDTYACIDGRGTHLAVDNLQKYMRKMRKKYGEYYIVKCDIKGFFYHIDKDVLYKMLARIIRDPKLLELTKVFIYEDNLEEKGLPIGNYTSQYFANIYLNVLDHFVKEKLRIKYYVRYMDDFVSLVETEEEAKNLLKTIQSYVEEVLKLELNSKSVYYPNQMGVEFCGFHIYEDYRKLRMRSRKKIRKKIKKWNKLYQAGVLDMHEALLSWNAWIAHSSHASCYHLQEELYNRLLFKEYIPFRDQEPVKMEVTTQEV